jgi:palmitoyltransferase
VACDKVFGWFWPFSATPDRSTGLKFEVNEFEGALMLFFSE